MARARASVFLGLSLLLLTVVGCSGGDGSGAVVTNARCAATSGPLGRRGWVSSDVGRGSVTLYATTKLSDGRVVALASAGNTGFVLVGYLADGTTLDDTFGRGGYARIALSGFVPRALAAQKVGANEFLVVGGIYGSQGALTRVTAGGRLDDAFAATQPTKNILKLPVDVPAGATNGGVNVRAIATYADGRIALVGEQVVYSQSNASGSWIYTYQYRVLVARALADGSSPDVAFTGDGFETYDWSTEQVSGNYRYHTNAAEAATVDAAGRLLVTGFAARGDTGTNRDGYLARFVDAGLDTTFNAVGTVPGVAFMDYGATTLDDEGIGVVADGNAAVAVFAMRPSYKRVVSAARFLEDGTPDAAFGNQGHREYQFASYAYSAPVGTVLRQANGSVTVAIKDYYFVGVVRFTGAGDVDPGFTPVEATASYGGGFGGVVALSGGGYAVYVVDPVERYTGAQDVVAIRLGDGGGAVLERKGGSLAYEGQGGQDFAHAVTQACDGSVRVVGTTMFGTTRLVASLSFDGSGAPDATHGLGGIALTVDSYAQRAAAVWRDTRPFVLTDSPTGVDGMVSRLLPEGALDPSYARFGRAGIEPVPTPRGRVVTMTLDGRAVVAVVTDQPLDGRAGVYALVTRRASDGTAETDFGGGTPYRAVRIADMGSLESGSIAAMVGPDGGIYVATSGPLRLQGETTARNRLAVVKLVGDGRPDTAFGVGGIVVAPVAAGRVVVRGMGWVAGSLYVGGTYYGTTTDMFVARMVGDGGLDAGYGGGAAGAGFALAGFGTVGGTANALVVNRDGTAIVGGFSKASVTATQSDLALVRFANDGKVDTTFGSGRVVFDVGGGNDEIRALALQRDGKVLAAGLATFDGNQDVVVVRWKADGTLDAP